jgi:D-glycero-D-manno-heptose 1,7-bisphosphate phosphatase
MSRAVFLDRDGTLNEAIMRDGKPYAPLTLEEFRILPGAAEGLAQLKAAGFLLIVVTNQPDVARGLQKLAMVEAMNDVLRNNLPLDDVLVCYHDDGDNCECRKPRPGLLLEGAAKYGVDLAGSFMVGDRSKDIEAGEAAGCRTVLIDYHYPTEPPPTAGPTARVPSIGAAAAWILSHS